MSIERDPARRGDVAVAPLPARARTLRRVCAVLVPALAVPLTAAAVGTAPAFADNPPGSHDPIGRLYGVHAAAANAGVVFTGWAADPDALTSNASIVSVVDGHVVGSSPTDIARPKVTRIHHTGSTPGFEVTVAVPSGVHTACVAVRDIGLGVTRVLGCDVVPLGTYQSSTQLAAHSPQGTVSAASATPSTMTVRGFGKEPDMLRRRLTVVLYVDGAAAATVNTHRASATQRASGSSRHGAFKITVPVTPGAHLGCVWAVNVGLGSNSFLGCTPVDTRGPAGTGAVTVPSKNKIVVKEAKKHIGQPYVWGATGPKAFDCSGLVMYSYGKANYTTPRVSYAQFAAARVIPASRAVPGDLVFYHDSLGHVYHVGIYLAPGSSVAAIDVAEGVDYQTIYANGYESYGSFTHN